MMSWCSKKFTLARSGRHQYQTKSMLTRRCAPTTPFFRYGSPASLYVCSHKVYKWRIYNGRHVRYVQKSPVRMSPSYVPFMCPLRVCSSCMPFICPFRVFALCALCVCLPSLCLSLRVSLRVSDPCLFYVSFLCAPLVCLFCLSLLLCLPSVCSMLERVYA